MDYFLYRASVMKELNLETKDSIKPTFQTALFTEPFVSFFYCVRINRIEQHFT